MPKGVNNLISRAIEAAEDLLRSQKAVSPVEVMLKIRRLEPSHIKQWERGLIGSLGEMVQGRLDRIVEMLLALREWALQKGLTPTEVAYRRHTREGEQELRFTPDAEPELEKLFRTHYVAPELGEAKQKKLVEKAGQAKQPVVFDNLRPSTCSECGTEIDKGDFLYMEGGQPLCLACGGFGGFEFLLAGDTALTRRAGKYSGRSAVVVRFSRSRKRYERQGILVEPEALEKAERECAADAGERAQARARAAVMREKQDQEVAVRMAARIRGMFPYCPPGEAEAIAVHTSERGSGRVGRSAAGQALQDKALRLAVTAAIRHRHTNYDELLAHGMEREQARGRVRDRVDQIQQKWEREPS
jgi:hypothetical protein